MVVLEHTAVRIAPWEEPGTEGRLVGVAGRPEEGRPAVGVVGRPVVGVAGRPEVGRPGGAEGGTAVVLRTVQEGGGAGVGSSPVGRSACQHTQPPQVGGHRHTRGVLVVGVVVREEVGAWEDPGAEGVGPEAVA